MFILMMAIYKEVTSSPPSLTSLRTHDSYNAITQSKLLFGYFPSTYFLPITCPYEGENAHSFTVEKSGSFECSGILSREQKVQLWVQHARVKYTSSFPEQGDTVFEGKNE